MNIIPANTSHVEDLANIIQATFHLACPPESDRTLQAIYLSKNLSAEDFERFLASKNYKIWIAVVDDKVAGLAVLEKASDHLATLSKIYVLPEFQGHGIAANLYSTLLSYAKNMGFLTLNLYVFSGNMRAKAFYERQGFKLVGTDEFNMESELHKDEVYELTL